MHGSEYIAGHQSIEEVIALCGAHGSWKFQLGVQQTGMGTTWGCCSQMLTQILQG
jgi:hypothetical protein